MEERLRRDLKEAMKRRDTTEVSVLRMALSDLRNREIELGRDVEEPEAVEVVRKAFKRREEAAEQFEKGGRDERAEQERREAEILERYLPRQLEGEELEGAVAEVIEDVGASGPGEMGRVMSELMDRHRGRVDGRAASEEVRRQLES